MMAEIKTTDGERVTIEDSARPGRARLSIKPVKWATAFLTAGELRALAAALLAQAEELEGSPYENPAWAV